MVARSTGESNGFGSLARHHWPLILSWIPALMIPLLEWLPGLATGIRAALIIGSVVLGTVGVAANLRRQKRLDWAESETMRLRAIVEEAGPEQLLHQISESLFRDGAWRLTVYRKVGASDEAYDLARVASIASGGDDESTPNATMGVDRRSNLASTFSNNLANPRYRQADESGAFPDDVHSKEWSLWRQGVLGAAPTDFRDKLFRPRKYAWYAAQDPRSQTVYIALAESTSTQGIAIDFLNHNSTPAWLFYVGEIFDLKQRAQDMETVTAERWGVEL